MPRANAFVGRITNFPAAGLAADTAAQDRITVTFDEGRTAMLPPGRRAASWQRMLAFTQRYDVPAYVETDPETSVITLVLIPMRVHVVGVDARADGDLDVRFIESHARHRLLRSNPDFSDMLNALEGARAAASVVLVTSTRDEHEIIDVRPAPPPPSPGPSSPPPGPSGDAGNEPQGDPPTPSVVTPAQAAQLFNDMAATTCDPFTVPPPCIPFLYPDDGCYARAHEMIRLMRLQGIEGEKIWIFGNLQPATSNHPDCGVGWWYHVAPTLQVDTGSGIEKRVIDPSLMTGPATADDWRTRQADPAATFQFTDAQPFWPNNGGNDDDYSETLYYLDSKRGYLQDRVNEFGPLPFSCPIVKQLQFILDRSTFGQDEITAMLQAASPAIIESALYIVLDGYTPAEVGITGATPTDPPTTIKPNLTMSSSVAQMSIVAAHLDMEVPTHLNRRQRITWTYDVEFSGVTGFNFVGDSQSIALGASFSGESAPSASIVLIKQPNPFEIDGATHWLSTDLRVFQINAGDGKFSATMGATAAQAPAFIQDVINNLNSNNTGGQTFDNALSTDQQTSRLELSEEVNNTKVFNFAVARVRYIGTLQAQDVRVFFRLFPASSTSLAFDTSTTYRRAVSGGTTIPLLGVQGNQLLTIPCFATPRVDSAAVSLTTQTDPPNVRTLAASPTESEAYFGAWLDINQTAPQFPLNPSPVDGPFPSNRKSVYELVRVAHQCLVAEIAFDPAPIPNAVTPGTSDKLAQRNLAFVESANPGVVGSRRIPQTFEVHATSQNLPDDAAHDELMIDWGRTPVGSVATIYLPEVSGQMVIDLASRMYRTSHLSLIDEHTVQTRTGGISWIPIPKGSGNLTGLLTIDLPPVVRVGQSFNVVARQVTGFSRPVIGDAVVASAALPKVSRRILGSFQVTIPVSRKELMLASQQRLLSNLRFIEKAIPSTDRWYAAFRRYVSQIASRVDGLGGDSTQVGPSPSGNWQQPTVPGSTGAVCTSLELATAALAAMLTAIISLTAGATQLVLGVLALVVLFVIAYAWISNCRPSRVRLALALLLGIVVGVIVVLLLGALGP